MIIPNINKAIALQVKDHINNRLSDLFIQSDDNICKPYVCILCDIFVKPKEVQLLSTKQLLKYSFMLKNNPSLNMSESLKDCYTVKNFEQLYAYILKRDLYVSILKILICLYANIQERFICLYAYILERFICLYAYILEIFICLYVYVLKRDLYAYMLICLYYMLICL